MMSLIITTDLLISTSFQLPDIRMEGQELDWWFTILQMLLIIRLKNKGSEVRDIVLKINLYKLVHQTFTAIFSI